MHDFFSLFLLFATTVRAEKDIEGVTKPSDVFWQLANLNESAPEKLGNVYLGGQNYTWCCLRAVEEGLRIDNGTLIIYNNTITNISALTTGDLRSAANRSQFPCDAKYNDAHLGGAPEVRVQYEWFIETCPGWSLSDKSNLNAWLHSLSGFLVPAVVFCLSVPRRRKLHVPRHLFTADIGGIKSIIPAILGAIIAGLIVTVDTIIWLSICFAFAGPMILSGLYEAFLDNRVLEFLRNKINNKRLTLDMRCRCLMLILIGNLDLALSQPPVAVDQQRRDVETATDGAERQLHRPPAPTDTTSISLPTRSSGQQPFVQPSASSDSMMRGLPRQSTSHLTASPWRHMENILDGLRLYDDDLDPDSVSPRQWARRGQRELPRTRETDRCIIRTKTRLRTMLHCQYSFGSIVGAPVIFFIGGFIFSFLTSLDELGDENIAESIAFGSWYMIIPHIAIISGLLLAGNNPNILEGVLATERDPKTPEDPKEVFGFLRFDLVYPSCYKVAWQWLRGHTKKRWIEKLLAVYSGNIDIDYENDEDIDGDMKDLRNTTTLSLLDWFVLLFLTLLLVGIPYLFAFMLAYFTPQIGLSCRSLTFLVYFSLQIAQVGLWLWAYVGPPGIIEGHTNVINATIDINGNANAANPANLANGTHNTRNMSNMNMTNNTNNANSTANTANDHHRGVFGRGGWLDKRGFFDPSRAPWHADARPPRINSDPDSNSVSKFRLFLNHMKRPRSDVPHKYWFLLWFFLYYSLQLIFGLGAVFVSLGGTLMQIMGVYRTNMCFINAHHWLEPKERRPPVVLSVNSRAMINSATTYWEPVAIAAIAFMAVVSFVGWWYQRRMRDVFGQLVKKIDQPDLRRVPHHVRPASETGTDHAVGNQQNSSS
ncbi:hypothetical protein CLIM01_07324 [Colletotrichum limetticola]|uniref:Uncharacterized protein n=1 Tax=Colletotrichum limetticola TaxID=1209924 RepID=A0ABQ9PUZ5_9PEZI|nr:hypothetical protein CLIM01_07324 [Colletotrichum limetticola]